MPFKSEKQRRYLWANEPEVAGRWEKENAMSRKGTRSKKKRKTGTQSSLLQSWKERR